MLGVSEVFMHQTFVHLTINVSCPAYDLLSLAKDRLLSEKPQNEELITNFGLFKPQFGEIDGIDLENRIDVFHSNSLVRKVISISNNFLISI